ncbi:extracellular solute-binding protein [Paenibacillus nasutitermitis]|uniref:ABC transporter substrate-binding protein n=1 Tax=Paenibacillus nasutitermitis TaxID=1652958 RepID=A0A916YLY2_9BACL|nr:extracellular solute-binding protein [Paenibacillus nasutitermitis]GGD51859.1 ABC transporter substrate-binding protein [Paenibacillus nasutitermitis]
MSKGNKGNKISAVLATILLSVSVLGACGSNDNSGSASPAASNKPDTTSSSDNKKVEKVYLYANYGQFSTNTTMSSPEALEEIKKVIIEKTGIEPVAIIPPKGSENDKLNLLLAGNEPLDIFAGDMTTHQAKGAVMPLNDLLDKYGPNVRKLWPEEWDASYVAMSTKDGKIWGIPDVPAINANTVAVREDWLKKLNLPVPKTFEDLENVLKAFKEKDPAGNGQTIPLLTDYNTSSATLNGMNMSMAAGFMDNGYGNFIDKDGKVKPAVFDPGYKDFITLMADWYKKGYIYKEAFQINARSMEQDLVKQNRVGVAALWYTGVLNGNGYMALRQIAPEANYIVVDLKGPKGDSVTSGGNALTGTMISKNSKNPEAAMKYINWVYSDLNNYMLVFFGIKDKHWKWVDESKHTFEGIGDKVYYGDYLAAATFAYTVQFTSFSKDFPDKGGYSPDSEYINKYITNFSRVKKPGTFEYDYKFDQKEITAQIPTLNDFNRMMEQEVVKFVVGARPIAEYDKFLEELNKVGLDTWVKAYTSEYNKVK